MLNKKILYTENLSEENILDLVEDRILALIVKNYYPAEHAAQLSQKIIKSEHVEKYNHEYTENGVLIQKYFGVDRHGLPFNSIYDAKIDDPSVDEYYNSAKINMKLMRDLSYPAIGPIDKLRLDLDENFKNGATIASFQGKKMMAGIGRITKANLSHLSAEQPHFDALPNKFANLDLQLAANIYLKVPTSGGELELWDVPAVDPLAQVPEDWRGQLPDSYKISPAIGDLVMFNCRRPHAIGVFEGEDRVSMQLFIGHIKNQSLMLWN